MIKIKFDIDTMKIMSLFESMTGANLKDCINSEGLIIFIVNDGEIGKAIGKKGINIRKLEYSLKKKIKVTEYNENLAQFIENLVYPAKVKEVKQEEKLITITAADSQSRGLIIGRGASILRNYESIVKRYFDIEEIKVVN